MALGEIVDVQISRDIPTVDRVGFGAPLFLTEDTTFASGTVNQYGSLDEVGEDYATDSLPYIAAQSLFGQGSGLSTVKVGHKAVGDDWPTAIGDVEATDPNWYALIIDSRSTADIEAVAANIEARDKLFLAATSEAGILDPQDDTDLASSLLSQSYSRTALTYHTRAFSNADAALYADVEVTAAAVGDYTITVNATGYTYTADGDDTVESIATGLAELVDADAAVRASADGAVVSITHLDKEDPFTIAVTGDLDLSFPIAFPEAAWAGQQLPEDPGATTWAFKTLAGIPTDSFTSAQRAALRAKRCNHYINAAGNAITYEGYTSEPGVFIDIIRGLDWLEQRMAEDIFAELASQKKIPYVGGGEILEQVVRSRMDIAVDRTVLAPGYTVEVPSADDQLATDRADRNYPGITFAAELAGAIHRVGIRGTVTV